MIPSQGCFLGWIKTLGLPLFWTSSLRCGSRWSRFLKLGSNQFPGNPANLHASWLIWKWIGNTQRRIWPQLHHVPLFCHLISLDIACVDDMQISPKNAGEYSMWIQHPKNGHVKSCAAIVLTAFYLSYYSNFHDPSFCLVKSFINQKVWTGTKTPKLLHAWWRRRRCQSPIHLRLSRPWKSDHWLDLNRVMISPYFLLGIWLPLRSAQKPNQWIVFWIDWPLGWMES